MAFNFGAPAASAPAPGSFSFSASSGGSSGSLFGAPASSGIAAPPSTFGGSFAAPASGTSGSGASLATTSNAAEDVVTVPDFDKIFPNLKILSKLRSLLPKATQVSTEGRLAGQELTHVLQTTVEDDGVFGRYLSNPKALTCRKQYDASLRAKLQSNPHVQLHGVTAGLTPSMLEELWKLSDDLRISEVEAMALYAHASMPQTRAWLEEQLEVSFVDQALLEPQSTTVVPLVLGNQVPKAARELYLYERSGCLKAIYSICQYRMEASLDPSLGRPLFVASDQLLQANLVENLISVIRDWTRVTEELEQEISNESKSSPSAFGLAPPPSKDKEPNFSTVLLAFARKERQMAAECLFFLAYHTQCSPEEVAALIDLVKDLTNGTSEKTGLPLLDPFSDVPSAYYEQQLMPSNPWGTPFTAPLPPLKEKDPVEWEQEWVKQIWTKDGKPQILQCVSTLVLSIMCTLDARHELMNRNSHGINEFGTGNALFPPTGSDGGPIATEQLLPIHTRLDPRADAGQNWLRKDIWGLLVASYALLLRSLPSVVASPRLSSAHSPTAALRRGPIDIKLTWRACLEAPTETKSFTYARLCLMPSLQQHKDSPSNKCDSYEFFMSVLAEFMSHYLDVMCASGDVPISRAQWESDEARELQLRREQQEQQRQFRSWSGAVSVQDEVIPSEVDLMKRPDCMDDVMALAIDLCSSGPEYAGLFWDSTITEQSDTIVVNLVPSRTLQKLEMLQESDTSLLPTYVSYLAGLAIAAAPDGGDKNNGAAAVDIILSREPAQDTKETVTWTTLMNAIRWYTRELSPGDYTATTTTPESSRNSSPALEGTGSTAYYYGATSDYEGSAAYDSSLHRSSGSPSSPDLKPKELGETNTIILLSHLGVIANVASRSPAARSRLVSVNLPIVGADSSSVVGEDPFLTVLFLLSLAPLAPMSRGAVFATIAALLKLDGATKEDRDTIKQIASKAWDLLEACRILPITLLDQYAFVPEGVAVGQAVMSFPPSSLSMVVDGGVGSWLPSDPIYGIIYEMEHVESRAGTYPSTEGFLQLLTVLFSAGGCPSDLGRNSRARSGCTPFMEYVINFVLPRVMGTKRHVALPFRTTGHKCRIVSRALEVVEAVLVRYTLPASTDAVPSLEDELKNQLSAAREASEMFGFSSLAEILVVPPDEKDVANYINDYADSNQQAQCDSNEGRSISRDHQLINQRARPSVPPAKSPGFTVMSDILSSFNGNILVTLIAMITGDFAQQGIRSIYGVKAYKASVAYALFGDTPPNVWSARIKSNEKTPSISTQSLLKPLLPSSDVADNGIPDAVFWREKCIILSLRILCGAAAREEAFVRAVSSGHALSKLVPVLRFKARSLRPTGLSVTDLQVSRLTELLTSSGGVWGASESRIETLPVIVQYLQYMASTLDHDAELATLALAIIFHISRSLSSHESLRALCGNNMQGQRHIAASVARRLLISSQRSVSAGDNDIASIILDWIVSTLRNPPAREMNIANILLGLPYVALTGIGVPGNYENSYSLAGGGMTRDCLDAIIDLASDTSFVAGKSSAYLAEKCFEIIYRLSETGSTAEPATLKRAAYATGRLRSTDFWATNLLNIFADPGRDQQSLLHTVSLTAPGERWPGSESILHCAAWLLKGVANELIASPLGAKGAEVRGSSQRRKLLSMLFSNPFTLMMHAIRALPNYNEPPLVASVDGSIFNFREAIKSSKTALGGAPEVVDGYMLVNTATLLGLIRSLSRDERSTSEDAAALRWAEQWNTSISWDCASSHLSTALRVLMDTALFFTDMVVKEDQSSGISSLAESLGGDLASFNAQGLVDMLMLVLSRLTTKRMEFIVSQSMGERLSSATSKNLCFLVLLLVEKILSLLALSDDVHAPTEGNMLKICYLIAGAMESSTSIGNSEISPQHVQTALLGTALGLMIQSDSSGSSFDDLRGHLMPAAVALGRLATVPIDLQSYRDDGVVDGQHSSVTVMARAALSTMLTVFREENISEAVSLTSLLTRPGNTRGSCSLLEALMLLVPTLDDQVSFLLEKITLCHEGPGLLVDARVTEALSEAAHNYVREEQRITAELIHQNVAFGVPRFFQGHILLLKALVISPSLAVDRLQQVCDDAVDIMLRYSSVVHRLGLSFPRDADMLIDSVECLTYAIQQPGLRSRMQEEQFAIWDKMMLDLVCHISENPLPQRLLPTVPLKLRNSSQRGPSSVVVSVSDSKKMDATWWDTVETAPDFEALMTEGITLPIPLHIGGWQSSSDAFMAANERERWSDQKYEAAILGTTTLAVCLSFLTTRANVMSSVQLDWFAISRGLCRCVDAAKGIEIHIQTTTVADSSSSVFQDTDGMDMGKRGRKQTTPAQRQQLEKFYITSLGEGLLVCCEKILGLVHFHLQSLIRTREANNVARYRVITDFKESISAALAHAQMESMGIGFGWTNWIPAYEIAKRIQSDLKNL